MKKKAPKPRNPVARALISKRSSVVQMKTRYTRKERKERYEN